MASPLPGENCFTDEDVARICRETPYVPNPGTQMLPRGTDMCRCPTCGLYFNSSFAFTKHRIGRVGTPERRCLTEVHLQNAGWRLSPSGYWRTPPSGRPRPGTPPSEKELSHVATIRT